MPTEGAMLSKRTDPQGSTFNPRRRTGDGARIALSEEGRTSRRQRKKVEMLFAHLKRILKMDRLRLRGPHGARDEVHRAAAAQNLAAGQLEELAKLNPPT